MNEEKERRRGEGEKMRDGGKEKKMNQGISHVGKREEKEKRKEREKRLA
jgi:hypothetical protein